MADYRRKHNIALQATVGARSNDWNLLAVNCLRTTCRSNIGVETRKERSSGSKGHVLEVGSVETA